MNNRSGAAMGMAAFVWFWVALAGFAALRPDYSHAHKAVSELGVIGAPNALAWNLVGFIVPGVLLALCGACLANEVDGGRKILWYLLVMAGVGFTLTGIFPAEMNDGDPVMQAPLTMLHVVAVMLSSLFWMLGALLLPWRTRRSSTWSSSTRLAVMLAVLSVGGSLLNIILLPVLLPQLQFMPGITQRIGFAFCLAWYLVIGVRLYRHAAPMVITNKT